MPDDPYVVRGKTDGFVEEGGKAWSMPCPDCDGPTETLPDMKLLFIPEKEEGRVFSIETKHRCHKCKTTHKNYIDEPECSFHIPDDSEAVN